MSFVTQTLPDGVDLSGWFTEEDARVYASLARRVRNGVIVEVGVWKGRSLSAILDVCRSNCNRIYAIDAFGGTAGDPAFEEASRVDVELILRTNLVKLGHADIVTIVRDDSADAARHFPDCSVDLMFLDADHAYDAVLRDLRAWLPKMAESGLVCGHDYATYEGVRRAVRELFADRVIEPRTGGTSIWIVELSG